MQENKFKKFILPIIAISIFSILLFGAGYAFFSSSVTFNNSNFTMNLPVQTLLVCTKSDCSSSVTPAQMSSNSVSGTAKSTDTCSLECTCSGTPGAVCDYNVRLLEIGDEYVPSPGLGTNKEYTVKVTSPSGCTPQNGSNAETQINTIKDKVVSSCSLTVPSSGSVSANVSAEFKWYNLNIDQDSQESKMFNYWLTNDDTQYTVTFDANGGTVGTQTKEVTYGEAYGDLPKPEWPGHTFKGWNGKNKFNEAKYLLTSDYTAHTSSYDWADINLKPNTTYRVSIIRRNGFNGRQGTIIMGYTRSPGDDSQWTAVSHNSSPNGTHTNFIFTPGDSGVIYLGYTYSKGQALLDKVWTNTDIQIEEGTTPTTYEPYYVSSSTKVTQAKDHTLTAIWE